MDEDGVNLITTRDSFWACVAGALAYGVLYLGAILYLAVFWRAPWHIEILAVAAAGAAYLSFFVQMALSSLRLVGLALVLLSIALGAAAGFYLLLFMLLAHG